MYQGLNKIKGFAGFAIYALIFASLIWVPPSIYPHPQGFGKIRSATVFLKDDSFRVERSTKEGLAKGLEFFAGITLSEDAFTNRNPYRVLWPSLTYTYSIKLFPRRNKPSIMAASNEWRPLVANLLAPQLLHSDFVSELSQSDISHRLVYWPSVLYFSIRLLFDAILIHKIVAFWKRKRRERRERLISFGYCPACLYDLRWATHDACPECGLKCEDPTSQTETIEP